MSEQAEITNEKLLNKLDKTNDLLSGIGQNSFDIAKNIRIVRYIAVFWTAVGIIGLIISILS